ncbi:MAG: SAM-dependent methyltransferase [Epsilonproteobacteria bacterium]|nr:SAM-dependent methyltransferase [Campylobacterota bacterium]
MQFSEFMQSWLYGKDAYYSKYREIGKGGDFYTAVSSSMFFGGSIANRLISAIEEGFLTSKCSVVEIGAHQGYMLADIVQFIYTLKPALLSDLKFIIIEPHPENVQAQLDYFKDSFGDLVSLKHYPDLQSVKGKEAFVVANEIFDAFSCELVKEGQMLYMNGLVPEFRAQSDLIKAHCQKYHITQGEVGVGYEAFAKSLYHAFEKFEFVTFDYGDKEKRSDFSIRVYHKHNTYPFFALTDFVDEEKEKPKDVTLEMLYKKSDITYDVNFGHLIDAFKESGVSLLFYKTQMAMLVEFGIIELLDQLQRHSDEKTYKSEMNRAKVLIDPAFMGERFKGVVFRKE